jgi:nucleotide-binding universal stress UspA family protein
MEFSGKTERVLAGVKYSDSHPEYIRFVLSAAQLTGASSVFLLHVAEDLSLLPAVEGGTLSPFEVHLSAFEKMVASVAAQFPGLEVHCDIREGQKDELLLHWIKVQKSDLLILGRRKGKLGSGSRSIRAARLAPCHVLLVPEDRDWTPVKNVLLPVDFSGYSELGIQTASRIPALEELICLNIYEVPSGYYYTGASEEEAEARMLKNAKDAWNRFIKTIPPQACQVIPAFQQKQGSLADDIQTFVQTRHFQLVVIGSKGLTGAVGFMMGSVTQEFIREFDALPVLIIKKRNERLSLIEALIG